MVGNNSNLEIFNRIKETNSNNADEYSNSKMYVKDEYCIYNNTLYKANQAIDTAEEFTESHWTETTVGTELKSQADSISSLNSRIRYVEDESAIGTWVNGKTIYRKCVLNNAYVNESASISLPDVDELISVKGSGVNVGGTYKLPVPYSDIARSSIYAYRNTNQSNFTFDVYLSGEKSSGYFTVFFEYTKS